MDMQSLGFSCPNDMIKALEPDIQVSATQKNSLLYVCFTSGSIKWRVERMVAKRFVVLHFLFKFYKKLLFPLSAIGLHDI